MHKIRLSVILLIDAISLLLISTCGILFIPDFGQTVPGGHRPEGLHLMGLWVLIFILNHCFFALRKIEFKKSSLWLYGFDFKKNVKNTNDRTIMVAYKDIYEIKALRLPLFGTVRIRIRANHIRRSFTFSPIYTRHKQLFSQLCLKVEQEKSYMNAKKQ